MKPQPVVVTTICSECGLAWEAHGDKPTTSDCIRLLKTELAKRPAPITITYPCVWTYPYYPQWYTQYQGVYSGGNYSGTAINCTSNTVATTTIATPAVSSTTCNAVAA